MTHYYEKYDHTDPAVNKAKAIKDIKSYLGADKFKQICKIVHAEPTMTRENFIFQMSMFIGIEGFPARAWADELGLVETHEEVAQVHEEP